mgnify:CR=1 FL=1
MKKTRPDGRGSTPPLSIDTPTSVAVHRSTTKQHRRQQGAIKTKKAFVSSSSKIALRNKEGFVLALLKIKDIWEPDLLLEAQSIFGTIDTKHPGVHYLLKSSKKNYIGGKIEKISIPHHYDYRNLRHTPTELKNIFKNKKWGKVIAFQTRNPLHKAHFELTMRAMKFLNANLLVHPVVGMTKPGDVNHYTRVRCYNHIMREYPKNSAFLSLLPLAMRMGGPKETLLHAIIRKNYGCTHLIVGRDHAGPGLNSNNEPFYEPYEAQEMLKEYQDELGIEMVPFKFMVFIPKSGKYKAIDDVVKGEEYKTLSGTELRQLLDKGKGIPEWFTFKSVANEKADLKNITNEDERLSFIKSLELSESERYFHRDINGEPYMYDFKVTSCHYLKSKDLFLLANNIMKNKLTNLKNNLIYLVQGKETPISVTNHKNSTTTYELLIPGEDDTLGNVIQSHVVNNFIDEKSVINICSYKRSHPLEEHIILTISINPENKVAKNNDEAKLNAIVKFLEDVINDISSIYDEIISVSEKLL